MRRSVALKVAPLFGLMALLIDSGVTEAGGRLFRRQACQPACPVSCAQDRPSGDIQPFINGSSLYYCDGTRWQYCTDPDNQECYFLPDSVWHTTCHRIDRPGSDHPKTGRVQPTATEPAVAGGGGDRKPQAESPKTDVKVKGDQFRYQGCIYIVEGGSGQFTFTIIDSGSGQPVAFRVAPTDQVIVTLATMAFAHSRPVTVIAEYWDESDPSKGLKALQVAVTR